jgi:hypothetical protein
LIILLDQGSNPSQKADEERLFTQKKFLYHVLWGDFKPDKYTLVIIKDQHNDKLPYDLSATGEKKGSIGGSEKISWSINGHIRRQSQRPSKL